MVRFVARELPTRTVRHHVRDVEPRLCSGASRAPGKTPGSASKSLGARRLFPRARGGALSLAKNPAALPKSTGAMPRRPPRLAVLFSPRGKERLSSLPDGRKNGRDVRPSFRLLFPLLRPRQKTSAGMFPTDVSWRTPAARHGKAPDQKDSEPHPDGRAPPFRRNRQSRAFRYALFTTFCGSPSQKRRMFSRVMLTMLRLAPSVIQAMCGVMSE